MAQLYLGKQEIEPGEEADDQEDYQRVGNGEEKSVDNVAFGRAVGFSGLFYAARRIGPEQIYGEAYQHHRSDNLNHVLVAFQKLLDK